jgi:HPt (histidine-containing phosphotransfer) domain-containing protein
MGEAKEIVDGDIELFQELVGMFLEAAPVRLEELRSNIEEGNMPEVRNRAHRIKGSLKNFAAAPGIAKAQTLEDAAEQGRRNEAETAFRELADEIEFLGYYYLKELWKERFYE